MICIKSTYRIIDFYKIENRNELILINIETNFALDCKSLGTHYIHLFWSDIPLVNSPFLGFAVQHTPDASKLILTGRGLKEAVVREEAEFVIDGSQAGRGTNLIIKHLNVTNMSDIDLFISVLFLICCNIVLHKFIRWKLLRTFICWITNEPLLKACIFLSQVTLMLYWVVFVLRSMSRSLLLVMENSAAHTFQYYPEPTCFISHGMDVSCAARHTKLM